MTRKRRTVASLWIAISVSALTDICCGQEAFPSSQSLTRAVVGATCDWKAAQWVFLEGKHNYMLARHKFELPADVQSALLHISARTSYRVHVNGQFVGDGPPRSYRTIYGSYAVGSLLRRGPNVIAVEVFSDHRHKALFGRDATAFLCRLDVVDAVGGSNSLAGGHVPWRVLPAKAWAANAPAATQHSPVEYYDSRHEPDGWRLSGFDDSSWLRAGTCAADPSKLDPAFAPPVRRSLLLPKSVHGVGEVLRMFGRGFGAEGMKAHDGTAVGREMFGGNVAMQVAMDPLLEEPTCTRVEKVQRLLEPSGEPVLVDNGYSPRSTADFYRYLEEQRGPPAIRQASIVLDFGELINGHFYLDVEGQPGDRIDIAWGQTLIGGRVRPVVTWGGGGTALGSLADQLILRGDRQRWESLHWESFRYVQLIFRDLQKPLKLHRFAAVKRDPPLTTRGRFACSDEVLTWAWQATERSVRATTQDAFMDNTFREKDIWGGECGSNAILTTLACYGDELLTRHFIRLFTRDQAHRSFLISEMRPNTPPVPPNGHPRVFVHPMRMAYALTKYFYYVPPEHFKEDEIYSALKGYLTYLAGLCNSNGLFENPPGWQWVDWIPLDVNRGEAAPQNLLHCLLLRRMADVTRRHGDTELADECLRAAERIDRKIYDRFWNESRGLYVDSVVDDQQRTRTFSEHTNYLALLAGLGRGGREQIIIEKLNHIEEDLYQVDVPFMLFALEALFALHHDDLAVEMMRKRYDRIKRTGSDTLWETWSSQMSIFPGRWAADNWSEAQSAAAVPAFILSSEVLGVKPSAPGFVEFDVNPHGGRLSWAEGVVPAPQGEIAVRWEKKADYYVLKVTVPEGARATVHLPPADAYTIDGEPLATDRLKRHPDGSVAIVIEKADHAFTAVGLKPRDNGRSLLDKQ